jgi:hypothetical protein
MKLLWLLFAGCGSDVSVIKAPVDADHDGFDQEVDCDDSHAIVNPDAPEHCDGLDNNCDGETDNNADDGPLWYQDADGDSYGDPALSQRACTAPANYVASDTDCDDSMAAVHPSAPEDDCADPTDYNCDGSVAYADADADGVPACEDCDDQDAGLSNPSAWYRDADGDGWGTGSPLLQCAPPEGYAAADGDCDDTDGRRSPGAPEVCDPADLDEDCDNTADDADNSVDPSGWQSYAYDGDGDGAGDPNRLVRLCDAPASYLSDSSDCDDSDATVHPGATEVCGGADEDCDGLSDDADPSVQNQLTWYADGDQDNYGGSLSLLACLSPTGYLAFSDDCDDGNPQIHPGATEVCDLAGTDEDCDGLTEDADPSAQGQSLWYTDADNDNYGGSSSLSACTPPAGYVADSSDCDDTDAATSPAGQEVCANADEDCDGLLNEADPSLSGTRTWYSDNDGDGYGDPGASTTACTAPAGTVATAEDCDDTDNTLSPGAVEVCGDSLDNNCDGATDSGCPPSGLYLDDSDAAVRIIGEGAIHLLGLSLAGGFDMDGDGTEDLAVGSGAGTISEPGAIYLYSGPLYPGDQLAGDHDTALLIGSIESGKEHNPERVSAIADLDGDGDDELFVTTRSGADSYGSLILGPLTAGTFAAVTDVDYNNRACAYGTSGGSSDALTGSPDWLCADPLYSTSDAGQV